MKLDGVGSLLMRVSRAQRRRLLGTFAVVGLVLVTLWVGVQAPTKGDNSHRYSVTFSSEFSTILTDSGNAPYFTDTAVPFVVDTDDIVAVWVSLAWTDQSSSPLTDPTVSFTISSPRFEAPNGTEYIHWTNFQISSPFENQYPVNGLPENRIVNATTQEEAIGTALENQTNRTAGHGDWDSWIRVGSAAGGRARPSDFIAYTIEVRVEVFMANASRLD